MKSLLSLFAVGLVASALLPTENAYALELEFKAESNTSLILL